jgi:pyruvate/2-oxoglutarate/acetoin dehydrogenase E1 component
MRWRTHNRFAAPLVLRVPGGFFKCGDPWHSMTNEVEFVHNAGGRSRCRRMPRTPSVCFAGAFAGTIR